MNKYNIMMASDAELDMLLSYGEEGTEEQDAEVDSWGIADFCDLPRAAAEASYEEQCKKKRSSPINVVLVGGDPDFGTFHVVKHCRVGGEE